jgi:hypothetical protein
MAMSLTAPAGGCIGYGDPGGVERFQQVHVHGSQQLRLAYECCWQSRAIPVHRRTRVVIRSAHRERERRAPE